MLKLFSGSALIRVSGAAAQLLLAALISRLCDITDAGIYFFGFAILIIVSTLVRLGSELSGLREVARLFEAGDSEGLKRAVDSRVFLVTCLGVVCGLATFVGAGRLAADTFGDQALLTLWFTAATIPSAAVVGLLAEVLKGAKRTWIALAFQNVAVPLIMLPLLVAAAFQGRPVASTVSGLLFISFTCVAIAALLFWGRIMHRHFGGTGWLPKPRGREIAQILREAPSLVVVSTTSVTMQWIGATLLGFLAPAADVAGYSIAMRMSIAVSIVHSAAASVVGPRMSIAHTAGDLKGLRRVSQETAVLISVITWPALILMTIFASMCMSIFGEDYERYASLLRILLLGQFVSAVIGHSGTVLVMAGRYGSAQVVSILAGSALAVLSFVAIPSLGAYGAAIAMSGAVIIGHLGALLFVKVQLGIWTIPTSLRDFSELLGLRNGVTAEETEPGHSRG